MKKALFTQEMLHKKLRYDPDTGQFLRVGRKSKKVGNVDKTTGYLRIWVFDNLFYAQRLAYFWMLGKWPERLVDHRDGDTLNNKWENFRPADHSGNLANRGKPKNNTSGLKGVSLIKSTGKWRASITVRGKSINVGHYDTKEDAGVAYFRAAEHFFGEFARMQ